MKIRTKRVFIALGGCVVAFLLGTLSVFLFSKQESFSDIVEGDIVDGDLVNIGDNPPADEPFLYEYFNPPANSFGMGETTLRFVNDSFWMDWANNTVEWFLEKSVNSISWNDCTYLLNVDKGYNESDISYKYTLNWTAEDKQYYRLIKRTNLSSNMSSYFNKGSFNRYLLNFSFDSGETYNSVFNWSDYENSSYADISSTNYLIKVSESQLFFEFIITSDAKLNNGQFVSVDPNFGETSTGTTNTDVISNQASGQNRVVGDFWWVANDGTPTNISVRTGAAWGVTVEIQCAIYEFVDNVSAYAGGVHSWTETRSIPSGTTNTWLKFDFNGTPPDLNGSSRYYLFVIGRECYDIDCQVRVNSNSGDSFNRKSGSCPYTNISGNPLVGEGKVNNYDVCIYCNYTVDAGNNPPTLSGEDPYNDSMGVAVTPDLYVVCTDSDAADTMNVTWRYNVSDSWYDFATNTSVSSGTNITQNNANFTNYSALYYWSINCSDGTDWVNETYHFTTVDPDWNNIATVFGNYTNTTSFHETALIFGNYTNSTLHRNIDTIFGNYTNNTLHRQIGNIVFGNYTNQTSMYQIGNIIFGNYTNLTSHRNIAIIFGNYTNNTLHRQIDSIIYGNYTNTTGLPTWNNIDIIFGNYTNNTLHRNIDTIFGNYTNDTALYNNIATIYGNYTNTTVLPSWNNIATIYGNYTNDTAMWNNIAIVFGNYTNTTVQYIIISNVYPGNNSFDIPLQPNVYALFNSINGSTLNISWFYGSQGLENTLLGNESSVANGTYNELFYAAINYSTDNYWRIQADDGHRWVNETFSFMTESDITILPSSGSNVGIVGAIGVFGLLGFIMVVMMNNKKKKKREYEEYYRR